MYKHETLEITFQIYPPSGCAIENRRKSTWLNPIIDGEEAMKLMGGWPLYIYIYSLYGVGGTWGEGGGGVGREGKGE